ESRELPGIKSVETLSASWGFLRWGEKEKSDHPAAVAMSVYRHSHSRCLSLPLILYSSPEYRPDRRQMNLFPRIMG
ncbi:hypothetical protein ACLED0_16460, partial [Lonsdalea quercina]|uniref:hypothetical protein n=1 Tax=Lonsdalea quercina TaxID=71657 RepID=UPI0039752F92